MGDDLAKLLFETMISELENQTGILIDAKWAALPERDRKGWEAAAAFARKTMRERIAGEIAAEARHYVNEQTIEVLMRASQIAGGVAQQDFVQAWRTVIYEQVLAERDRQDKQWGGPAHDDEHTRSEWLGYLREHADRAVRARGDDDAYRQQLVKMAALAVAAIESHDRKAHR